MNIVYKQTIIAFSKILTGGDGSFNWNHEEQRKEIEKEVERMKKLFDLKEEDRIRKDKKRYTCEIYRKERKPGRDAWRTMLTAFRERIPPGAERPKGKWKYTTVYNQQHLAKWGTHLLKGFACLIPPSMWPILRGGDRSFKFDVVSRTGLKVLDLERTPLVRGVIGPISTPNDYLNTIFDT